MDSGKKIFTVSGASIFESGEPHPGKLHMKDQKGIISFQWIPDKCDNLNLDTDNIEGSQIFIFLHLLKKITRTIGENNSTIIRFLVPDSRANVTFTFPESEIASIEQMFTYLVSQNSVVPVQNDPTSFNINIEIEKTLSCPDKFILYNNVAYLQANSVSISKLLEDQKEIDKILLQNTSLNNTLMHLVI
ncbi:hypothetical protein TVAG_045600 [Trichomonas vaginalis G3]|uniref:Uncharacterized protein n=1 Tax=Trichomonas vaginalis (strain ATCC PRA-98 / G3) TaxID=412133 RepID=A2DMD1_TRIV3|nr:hypothetical protein TVAG_045600 [Trichomonas vaginalis G3]|eukprot:XP_001579344.1 hypothetical protein [Trichomonas vaginalis G3]